LKTLFFTVIILTSCCLNNNYSMRKVVNFDIYVSGCLTLLANTEQRKFKIAWGSMGWGQTSACCTNDVTTEYLLP
uniref:Uncharacterized protein n=1 Tax=Nothobranchius furzeri TaxID=105023 RepID=A0A8C6M335_NOTFU